MSLVVFTGSSLSPADIGTLRPAAARAGVDLVIRPPIVRGDLLSLPESAGWASRVLILDGEFGQSLSVSVTEIREFLGRGQYLAGASSMGALRAVECRTLGMRRHGWVARQYLDGHTESDAEVALLMDPVSFGALTVPLINIRWLGRRLEREGMVSGEQAARIVSVAGEIHYRERTPGALREQYRRALPASVRAIMDGFLAAEAVPGWDRKRLDGLAAVTAELRSMTMFSSPD